MRRFVLSLSCAALTMVGVANRGPAEAAVSSFTKTCTNEETGSTTEVSPGDVVTCVIQLVNDSSGPTGAPVRIFSDIEDAPDGTPLTPLLNDFGGRVTGGPVQQTMTCTDDNSADPELSCRVIFLSGDDAVLFPGGTATIGYQVIVPDDAEIGSEIQDTPSYQIGNGTPVVGEPYTLTVVEGTPDCTITGSGAIVGTPGDDVICGSEGADSINGGGGNDIIFGFGGNDSINGGSGNDVIDGGDGADRIVGGAGNDEISGGAGQDLINGQDGFDVADGGADNDTCLAEQRTSCP